MKLFKMIAAVLVLSTASFGQNYFSSTLRNNITSKSIDPQMLLFDIYMFDKSPWGIANFSFASKGWAESMVGLVFAPNKTINATVYLGVETVDWWIVGADATLNWKRFSWYNYYEFSKGYDCWRSVLSVEIVKNLKARGEAYASFNSGEIKIGPGICWTIPSTPISVMPTVLYKSTEKKPYLELDICSSF
jgi:hypothetical protein